MASPQPKHPIETFGEVDLYIAAGQSNMVGEGRFADLPANLMSPRPGVLFRRLYLSGQEVADVAPEGQWIDLQPSNPDRGFGPELSFGHSMADHTERPLAILKCAKGGSGLYNDWRPHVTDDPMTLTNQLIQQGREALDAFERVGLTMNIAGILWYQGECDSQAHNPTPERFGSMLRTLLNRLRTELPEASHARAVLFRVNPLKGNPPHYDTIRRQIQEVADSDPMAAWVQVDDLPHPDAIHLNSTGLIEAGQRAAEHMRRLLASPPED